MKITEEEVRYVADLGNLRLTEEEVHRFAKDMDEILTHIGKLNELDTENVEPMAQVLHEGEPTASLRQDIEHIPLDNKAAVENAALAGNGYFKVPLVIER